MSEPIDPDVEGASAPMRDAMSYGDYLRIDDILGSQAPLSDAHDEMLFIVQHQTSELWMRLVLHELDAARRQLTDARYRQTFKMLSRVSRVFDQLNSAWDVLRTMTPSEYTVFRDALGRSSGFQSHQYRLIEFALGNRNRRMLRVHEHRPDLLARLRAELARPSIYHVALDRLAEDTGVAIPPEARALERPHRADERVLDAWTKVYERPDVHWNLYELGEKLIDLEDYFRRWRFNHVTTVERVIGSKRGTGGTSGVAYLRKMLDVVLFPELWDVRGRL